MSGDGARSVLRSALLPLAAVVAPSCAERAAGRARNLLALGAGLPWLLPRSPVTGTATDGAVVTASVAFGAAAVVTHFVRRRAWGGAAAGAFAAAAAVVEGVVAGFPPRPWAPALAAVVVLGLLLSLARRAADVLDEEDHAAQTGWAGIAWSLLWALVAREFAALPIHVPTGSMQPTIYGARPHAGGDRLIVDRVRYLAGDPQRFDIAVFEYPLHRPTTFVKRVIGLPGETVEIRDGDLWIDGRIVVKPPMVQETMWRETFPRPNPLAAPLKVAEVWSAADRATGGGWSVEADGAVCAAPKAGGESALRWTRRLEQGDVRLRFELRVDPLCTARVRLRCRGHLAELVVPGSATSAPRELRVDGGAPLAIDPLAGVPDEMWIADGRAVVRSQGRTLAAADVPLDTAVTGPFGRPAGPGRLHGIELAVSGSADPSVRPGPTRFLALRVDLDQRWLPAADGTSRWRVREGSYLVLGDNAQRSEDSREWRVTELTLRDGRVLRCAPEVPGDTGAPQRNLRTDGDAWVFRDVDGVPRRVPRADVASRRDGVPESFVPRDHFLGRAALVFWPWVPSEGGFRPRLLP